MKQMMQLQGEIAGTKANLSEKQQIAEGYELANAELRARMEEVQAGYMNEVASCKREIENQTRDSRDTAPKGKTNTHTIKGAWRIFADSFLHAH